MQDGQQSSADMARVFLEAFASRGMNVRACVRVWHVAYLLQQDRNSRCNGGGEGSHGICSVRVGIPLKPLNLHK